MAARLDVLAEGYADDRVASTVVLVRDGDAVIVVDADNRLIDDVTIVELFLAEPHQTIESLIGPPWPITVSPDADEEEVAAQLLHARHSSVIVIDGDGRPIGRVFTDDVIDALTGQAERWQRPRHH